MNTDFRFVPIERETFESVMSDGNALPSTARWLKVDEAPGFPCRVSLRDADIGEAVLAIDFEHHAVESPYRARGPIFVRSNAETAKPKVNEIPVMFHHRQLSVRGYDENAMMIAAAVTRGDKLEETIRGFFENPAVRYLHLHNAGPGCFNCVVRRA